MKKAKKLSVIVIVFVAIIALIAIAFSSRNRSYSDVVKTFVNASLDSNAKKVASLFPDPAIIYTTGSVYDKDELTEYIEQKFPALFESLESRYMDLSNISYEITAVGDMSESTLAQLKYLHSSVGTEIEEAKILDVELSDGSDSPYHNKTIMISVVKIGRLWYLAEFIW